MSAAAAVDLLLFDTTHHALWAEEIAQELGVAVDIVPAPVDARAGCDLALECLRPTVATLRAALDERGVQHRLYVRSGSEG